MPLSIVYQQNGAGRSGHQLKDLFSSVTLALAVGADAIFDASWANQEILPLKNIAQVLKRERS